mgnify:FL=1
MQERAEIFCVEDDGDIRELIEYTLKTAGFEVRGFEGGAELFEALESARPQLILLDIMLSGTDGMKILKQLREKSATADIPVIMVTAKSDRLDKVRGLDCGADDYVTKPFDILELIARIKAVLRRSKAKQNTAEVLECGEIEADLPQRRITVSGNEITLTYKEFELLVFLMENKGKVVTRTTLLDKIWNTDFEGESRTVDVHIRTLRQKLGAAGELIETVRNVGYRMCSDV